MNRPADDRLMSGACAQYAGNVLVFGNHPCSGDWFGGLRADDAEAFIAALTDMECVPAHLLLPCCM